MMFADSRYGRWVIIGAGMLVLAGLLFIGGVRMSTFFPLHYRADRPPQEVKQVLMQFYRDYPANKVPTQFLPYINPALFSASNPLINAEAIIPDSSSFYFYLPERNFVLWVGFDNLRPVPGGVDLILVGSLSPNQIWRYYQMMDAAERKELWETFSASVAQKLKGVTVEEVRMIRGM